MTSSLIDSGITDNLPWILTDQWELIFNPEQKPFNCNLSILKKLLDNNLWRQNVRSVVFNKDIHFHVLNDIFSFDYLFDWYESLEYADLSGLDLNNYTSINYIFNNCTNLQTVQFPSCNFGNNISFMDYAFCNCKNLHTLDFSHFFPKNMTSMNAAFSNCSKLTTLDLSSFQFNNHYPISLFSCFENCTQLSQCLLPHSIIYNSISLRNCFCNCTRLKSIDLSCFIFKPTFYYPSDLSNCFENCTSIESIKFLTTQQYPPNHFSANEITTLDYFRNQDGMLFVSNIFSNCPNLKTFKTEAIIPYNVLKQTQISEAALSSYFSQFSREELYEYLSNETDPSLKSELMILINDILKKQNSSVC